MKRKLYFVTAIDHKKNYLYTYVLAISSKEAKNSFISEHSEYEIKSVKVLCQKEKNADLINKYTKNNI